MKEMCPLVARLFPGCGHSAVRQTTFRDFISHQPQLPGQMFAAQGHGANPRTLSIP